MNPRQIIQRRLRPEGDGLNPTVDPRNDMRRRRRLAAGALAVVALLVALLVLGPLGGDEDAKPGQGRRGIGSTAVKRQTLVERETVEGTLGYAGARAVVNRLAGGDGAPGGGGGDSDGRGGSSASGGGSDAGGGGSDTGGASAAASGSGGGAITAQNASLRGAAQAQDDGTDDEKGGEGKGGADKGASDKERARQDEPSRGRSRHARGGRGRDGNGVAGSKSGGGGRGGDSRSSGDREKPGGGGGSTGAGGSAASDRGTSQGSGTVTRLAREGSILGRGKTLYELDNHPVVLMYGSVPAHRRLNTATTAGPDVRQLERNLVALGFGAGVTVDEHFTAATAAAVRRWQRSLGLPQTGAVELGRVVFLPGARRIGRHKVELGSVAATGAEVLETTSARRVVGVELDVAKQGLVKRGDKVTVTLPGGTTVSGRITRVGRVARKDEGDGGTGGGDAPGGSGSGSGELVIDVSIVLQSRRGVSRLDQAPVTVGIAQETRRSVLAVPVTALVARVGGGYGVEILRGGRRRTVPVRTGLFANGLVEISGRGIHEGTTVAIPEEA